MIGIGLGLVYTLFVSSISDTFLDLNANKKYDISEKYVDTNNNGVFDSDYIDFTKNWISPFGKIFLNLIKLFAIPLIIVSLIKGISSISSISKLSKMGLKTIIIYITTTFISVTIGLLLVNSFNPGLGIKQSHDINYTQQVDSKENNVKKAKNRGPLQPIVDIVPDNIFKSTTSNKNMLQIVFISILLGIGLLGIPKNRS